MKARFRRRREALFISINAYHIRSKNAKSA